MIQSPELQEFSNHKLQPCKVMMMRVLSSSHSGDGRLQPVTRICLELQHQVHDMEVVSLPVEPGQVAPLLVPALPGPAIVLEQLGDQAPSLTLMLQGGG